MIHKALDAVLTAVWVACLLFGFNSWIPWVFKVLICSERIILSFICIERYPVTCDPDLCGCGVMGVIGTNYNKMVHGMNIWRTCVVIGAWRVSMCVLWWAVCIQYKDCINMVSVVQQASQSYIWLLHIVVYCTQRVWTLVQWYYNDVDYIWEEH